MSRSNPSEPAVWVFFYGSYMNRRVLAGAYVERIVAPARELGLPDEYIARLERWAR